MFLERVVMYTDKCFFVMPTFNTYKDYQNGKVSTRATVHEVLKDLITVIRENLVNKQEILIINDGSTDNTEKELLDLLRNSRAIQLPERGIHNFSSYKISVADLRLIISVLTIEKNMGLNLAVLRGYKEALNQKPDFIIKLDSDGQHNPSDFPKLLERIKKEEKLKFVNLPRKLGFLIISYNALREVIDEIEKIAHGPEKRGIDRKTKNIIRSTFEKDAVWPY